jgi:predicted membrane protein
MVHLSVIALYVGPDQMMPVASFLAAIAGFLMIFWNKVIGVFRRIFGGGKAPEVHPEETAGKETQPKP